MQKIKQDRRETGKVAPATTRRRRRAWDAWSDWLVRRITERPDIYLRELQVQLQEELGVCVSLWTLSRGCRELKITRKKKTLIAAEQDREDVQRKRQEWRQTQGEFSPEKVVFIDETWAKTNMTRTNGRAPMGTRVVEKIPAGRWQTTTFMGALRVTGFVAPLTIDGPLNGLMFLAWVEQHLAPTLSPGDCVVMDNLSSHKVAGVSSAIQARSARLVYLPPCSPI